MMNKIKFFQILNTWSKAFPISSGFGPLPSGMPFLHPNELAFLKESWDRWPKAPGLNVAGGRLWPDMMLNGGGGPSCFLSQRVVDSLNSEGIPIHRLTEMPIGQIQTPKLLEQPIPKYYVLEAKPGISLDYLASEVALLPDGKPDMDSIFKRSAVARWWLDVKTWNGADLMGWPNALGLPMSQLIVSQRIVDIAKRDKWSNMRFDPIWAV